LKLLDCTLRDGGYYNEWDFDFSLVKKYLQSMAKAKIDFVELGLRQFKQKKYLGAFAYTPESLLDLLELPNGPSYGVMVDAKTILNSDTSIEEAVESLFADSSKSKISLVRIAAHPFEVPESKSIVTKLNNLGYIVGLNIMQISTLNASKISELSNLVNSWEIKPDVLYFADSLGNLEPDDISQIIDSINIGWKGPLGFHAHNNQGMALQNAKKCLNKNVEWLDATMTGMGRGAGNLTMEDVFLNILPKSNPSYSQAIFELANSDFKHLQSRYQYGPNLLYRIGAKHSIHPTYIQTLLSDPGVYENTHLEIINRIANLTEPNKFNTSSYEMCVGLNKKHATESSEINPSKMNSNIHELKKGKDFLIIGSGESVENIKELIPLLVKDNNLATIAVNYQSSVSTPTDFLCATPNNNLLAENKNYFLYSDTIVTPENCHESSGGNKLFANAKSILYFDYCLGDEFLFAKSGLVSKYDLSAAYSIAVAICMGARKIYCVGFDGYPHEDIRYLQMVEIIKFFQDQHGEDNLISLTKTRYPMPNESIFGYLS